MNQDDPTLHCEEDNDVRKHMQMKLAETVSNRTSQMMLAPLTSHLIQQSRVVCHNDGGSADRGRSNG